MKAQRFSSGMDVHGSLSAHRAVAEETAEVEGRPSGERAARRRSCMTAQCLSGASASSAFSSGVGCRHAQPPRARGSPRTKREIAGAKYYHSQESPMPALARDGVSHRTRRRRSLRRDVRRHRRRAELARAASGRRRGRRALGRSLRASSPTVSAESRATPAPARSPAAREASRCSTAAAPRAASSCSSPRTRSSFCSACSWRVSARPCSRSSGPAAFVWRTPDGASGLRLAPRGTVAGAFVVGLAWGWIPCGLVYSVLATALVSGSAPRAAPR